jgi:hypothetical protein
MMRSCSGRSSARAVDNRLACVAGLAADADSGVGAVADGVAVAAVAANDVALDDDSDGVAARVVLTDMLDDESSRFCNVRTYK